MMTKKRPKINKTKWSEKNRYKHIHTGEHCTFEAYLAEKLILRWTEAFKMDKPSYKFWTAGDRYHESFMRNMKAAKGLSKKFPESIILQAIDSPHFEKIFHIGVKCYGPRGWKYNQVALQAIKSYHKEQEEFAKIKEKAIKTDDEQVEPEAKKILKKRNKTYTNKKNSLNKLRDL